MEKLPGKFLEAMRCRLGDEFGRFQACFDADGYTGLRVNTSKITAEEFAEAVPFQLTRVPWTENGFYYEREEAVTKYPYYYAGLYYVQEPSAMLPASRLPVQPGDVVLDLCAAPGGKATELSARLRGSGLLVANDASASRAKALVKNLAVWGAGNCCITGETPERLLEQFGCCFDKILVDAPCSGEGMFRKDSGLIRSWEERGPESYAPVQIAILDCAVQMLRPGGMLAYSTCTFSYEEDEAVIAELLRRYPELSLVQQELCEGFAPGDAPCEKTVRLWPHRVKGEGHFLALLQKDSEAASAVTGLAMYSDAELQKNHAQLPQPEAEFLELLPRKVWEQSLYEQIGEQCLLLPPYRLPKRLRYLRTGVLFGTLKRGRFEPSQSLAMQLKADDFQCALSLRAKDERCIRYLKGETLELTEEEEAAVSDASAHLPRGARGWTLICVDGFGLGWGKYVNGTIRNKYYPGWRLQ